MRFGTVLGLGVLAVGSPLAAQDNPFALTGGSVKTAYIVYDVTGKQKEAPGGTYEVGVAPDRWVIRMVTPFEMAGKKDTARIVVVTTKDSQYTHTSMGGATEGEVTPTLRPHLARAYAALDAGGKARFRQNARLAAESSGSSDADAFMMLIGEKTGTETIASHKCDVYRTKTSSACIIPNAPMVMLRWQDAKQGVTLVARKITLNGPLPPAVSLLPKGVQWKRKAGNDADFISNIWALKKQSDPDAVPPATLTQFSVGYLASPAAAAELREMGGASGEASETGELPSDSSEGGN